jgi:hypothetical protein
MNSNVGHLCSGRIYTKSTTLLHWELYTSRGQGRSTKRGDIFTMSAAGRQEEQCVRQQLPPSVTRYPNGIFISAALAGAALRTGSASASAAQRLRVQ